MLVSSVLPVVDVASVVTAVASAAPVYVAVAEAVASAAVAASSPAASSVVAAAVAVRPRGDPGMYKGVRWMPWRREAMKDVARCEKPRGDASDR